MNKTRPGCSASTNSGSWLTITIVPGQAASARATPVRDGGSRLFVGSSSRSRLCRPATCCASASFVFSPPDSVPASCRATSPVRLNIPSNARRTRSSASGACSRMCASTGTPGRRRGKADLHLALATRSDHPRCLHPLHAGEDRLRLLRPLGRLSPHHLGQQAQPLDLRLLAVRQRGQALLLEPARGLVLRVGAA